METPTKSNPNVLMQSNRRKSQFFHHRQNASFDDPCTSSSSIHHGTSLFHTDSGYTSESLSFDSPDSYHGQHRNASSVSHLAPIYEGVEMQCNASTVELTPTTRHQLSNFHITTPASPANKRQASTSLQSMDSASANKSRRLGTLSSNQNVTPRKGATLRRQKSFMHKLDDSENIENQPAANFYADRMEFSPILGSRGAAAFERKPSDHSLQSSTPIETNLSNRMKGNTGHKVQPAGSRRFRKTQSFSPSKYFHSHYDLSAPRSSIVLDLPSPKPPSSPLVSGTNNNPARKLLDFNEGAFESLVKPNESRPVLNRQAPVATDDVEMSFSTPAKQKSPLPTTPTTNPNSNHTISNTDLMLHSAILIESPNLKPICHKSYLQTPKKLTRSFSLTSPRREHNDILYAHLPCTPPKSASKRKRLASTKFVRRSPVKRKLYDTKARPCFVGMEKLDIVGKLEHVLPAIDRIYMYLNTSDLISVRQVSHRWRRTLESHKRASARVRRKARREEVSKENIDAKAVTAATPISSVCHKSRVPFSRCNSEVGGAIVATPLALEPDTPVLSPRTRAFQDNQLIIKNLTKSQRLKKCPSCMGTSIIDRSTGQNSMSLPVQTTHAKSTPKLGTIVKHQSCPFPFQTQTSIVWPDTGDTTGHDDSGLFGMSVDRSINNTTESHLNHVSMDAAGIEYGRCTNKACGFVFCVHCLCAFHGDRKCRRVSVKVASSRERTPCVAGTKQSKRNLRRLCSLDP